MAASFLTAGTEVGSRLRNLLDADIKPGSDLDYETAKDIYCYHPLGRKLAESPITMAQSQPRDITVQDAPGEVADEFERVWESMQCDSYIHDAGRIARIYGISSIVAGSDKVKASEAFDMERLADTDLYFNVLDPLNTAGSLVLSQIPTARDFNKPAHVSSNGVSFHPSRFQVVMNERPIYLSYTVTAFGFVGRSVYQRALYPMKSYLRSMIADDMIQTKLGVFIAKIKSPGSVINNVMKGLAAVKRAFVKEAQTGNVVQIGETDSIETLNMQNADGAGTYSRTNILKNIATSADMPAKLVENETLVMGFGEGTEDAKQIVAYIESVRQWLQPIYAWFDNYVQYRAWNQDFFARIQRLYPEQYGKKEYADVFSEWRRNFAAAWPSLLREPESEQVKVAETKFQAIVSLLQTVMPECDADNKVLLIQSALDNISENKTLFPQAFTLDYEQLRLYQEKKAQAPADSEQQEFRSLGPEAKKFGRFG